MKDKNQLDGAHDSLVDATAQMEMVHDEQFFEYLNKPHGIVTLESILEPKREKREK